MSLLRSLWAVSILNTFHSSELPKDNIPRTGEKSGQMHKQTNDYASWKANIWEWIRKKLYNHKKHGRNRRVRIVHDEPLPC